MDRQRQATSTRIRAWAAVLLTALAACSAPAAPAAGSGRAHGAALPEFARLARGARPSVVQVKVSGGRELGEASGFVFAADGVIVTNAHVVSGADTVLVRMADKREFAATVLGADLVTDVAVLRIAATRLPPLPLGNPAQLRAGDWVLAIGSPFGFDNTVTAGVVSALQREVPGQEAVRFIQTDVPINPGGSGSPLMNRRGEVVGLNAQIYSLSGGYDGLSFAIPIDVVRQVAGQIVATGHAVHGSLAVVVQDVDTWLAQAFRLQRPRGALVADVEQGGAGADAGLRAGDVVLAIDRRPVASAGAFSSAIAGRKPGERVHLSVWREGAALAVQATLGDGSSELTPARLADHGSREGSELELGLLPAQAGDDAPAVLVTAARGRAALAGLEAGDILLAIDGRPVDSPAAAGSQLGSRIAAALLVRRGDEQRYIALPAAAK